MDFQRSNRSPKVAHGDPADEVSKDSSTSAIDQSDMSDLSSSLEVLSILPDANLELSPQPLISPPTEFTCLRILPTELQLAIWKETLPGPRLVDLNLTPHDIIAPVPVAFYVCHSSRVTALAKYSQIFLECQYLSTPGIRRRALIIVDTVGDTIKINLGYHGFIRNRSIDKLAQRSPGIFERIHHLELQNAYFMRHSSYSAFWTGAFSPLLNFKCLKTLHLVAEKDRVLRLNDTVTESESDYAEMWPRAEDALECAESFWEYYEKFAEDGSSVPDIYLHDWRRSQVRTRAEAIRGGLHFSFEERDNLGVDGL